MSTSILPIPDHLQSMRSWRVSVDGAPLERVEQVIVESDTFGRWAYGLTPAGHDGWSFREPGGGGSVIVPYVVLDGELHVGVVRQLRHNQGGVISNAPRGFVEGRESHLAAACRELAEEMGLEPDEGRITPLGGEPANPNSAFFDTSRPGDGVWFFALELRPDEIERRDQTLTLRRDLIRSDPTSQSHRVAEAIVATSFIPWTEAARLADMFTNAAVARLLAHLHAAPSGRAR